MSRFAGVLGGASALLLAATHASGQAEVTRVVGPQPWRPATGASESFWSPGRNEMAISADDRWVVFESGANDLTPSDKNVRTDIFVFEVATGRVVGVTSNANFTANSFCYDPSISGDGQFVVFATTASNLVAGDTNSSSDIFLVDRDPDRNGVFDEQPYTFERISVDSGGGECHGACTSPSVSDHGDRVLFLSDASDLVANDGNGVNDAFLRDRRARTTDRVDVDSNGNEANYGCGFADLSADGNVAAFLSDSDNLDSFDSNGVADVFVHDVSTGVTERVAREVRAHGVAHPIQMTVATTDGASTWAFRYSSEGKSRSLFFSTAVDTLRAQYPDNPMLHELSSDARLVVSEPLGDLAGAWNEVPESSYGVVQAGDDELRPFRPRSA
jgi:hypothetical protein